MRRVTPALALLFLAAWPGQLWAGLWEFLRGYRDLEVITVTDVTPAGRDLPAPSPAHPQYYIAASLGYHDIGGIMGGIRQPPPKEVIRLISAELAKQGYLPGTPQSAPPSLVLVFTWGTLNADLSFGGDPSNPPIQRNQGQIVRFLGGPKVGLHDDIFSPLREPAFGLAAYNYKARSLLEVSRENFYMIVVAAYDIERMRRKELGPPLWATRIACPSLGFALPNVIPAMLAIGGPQFGRDTPQPVWINATDKFKPNVTLGELQLLEYLKDAPLPVTELPAADGKNR